jgi:PAS domain S-box-containing protein
MACGLVHARSLVPVAASTVFGRAREPRTQACDGLQPPDEAVVAVEGTIKAAACDSDNKAVTGPQAPPRPPHLVVRFALYSALALLLAGVGILWFVRHEAQARAEDEVTNRVTAAAVKLAPQLRPSDLRKPVSGARLIALDELFRPELTAGVVRVKIWRRDGVVTYSNDHSLIGMRAEDAGEFRRVLAGDSVRETGRLNDEGGTGENIKIVSAYVPVRVRGETKPTGVLEYYNDYRPVAEQVGATVKPIALALGLALLLLYASLFPILNQVTRALEHRNRRLNQQAEELERTLNERRQAVASLRDAETRYRTLVEQLPLVTYVSSIDRPGFSAYVSPQIEELLGYTPDAWLETPNLFWRVVHPDDVERVRAEHRTGYAAGGSFSTQYRLVARDGRTVWVQDEVMVVEDEAGKAVQAQGFLLDITHRKAAEFAVRENEERFRTLVSNVPGVIFRCAIDEDWTMEYLSDEIEELVGYPAPDFIASRVRTFTSIIHPDDAPVLAQEVDAAVAENRPYTIEYRVLHRDGSMRYVVERGQAVLDAHGERMLDGAIFDLTARKLAEEARLELAAIVESSPDAIIGTDLDERVTSWNLGAKRLFGYDASEVIGQNFTFLVPEDRKHERASLVARAAAGEAIIGFETIRMRKDGAPIDVSVTISAVTDSSDAVIGVATITQDITARKQTEGERQRLLHELEAQNERLLELDRLKDEFVALVSHELRTPLTSIRGYLELLLEGEAGELTDEQRQFLGVVERNAHRLLALVGDLLFLAQVEAGKLSLEIGAVDLSAVAAECVETSRPLADDKGLTLTLAASPVGLIAGDRARLTQLLDNLISNGVKFTPAGGRVDVRIRGQRGNAVVEVRDTGMGIPPDEQGHLFERFFRTSKATEQAIPGTGLGLAISKAIVQAHGGRITVASDDGDGSTFCVSLPIRQVDALPAEAEEMAS